MIFKKSFLIFLVSSFLLISSTKPVFAVIQSLNNQTGQNQTFVNDTNVGISSFNNIHTINWLGILNPSRGGTGATSFLEGSLLFFSGGKFSESNTDLYWDNTNKRLGIGTNTPNEQLELTGNIVLPRSTSMGGMIKSIGVGGIIRRFLHFAGQQNFFGGEDAGNLAVTGTNNTGIGWNALSSITSGGSNTVIGAGSLYQNTTGAFNTALGVNTLPSNTSGFQNIAIGANALQFNTTGFNNNASGINALGSTTTGIQNIGMGQNAGGANITGSNNTFIGNEAGNTGTSSGLSGATAIGYNAQVTASDSLILGSTSARIGIGVMAPNAKLHVNGGNIAISTQGNGIILRASDGPNCYLLTVNNTGVLNTTIVTCP